MNASNDPCRLAPLPQLAPIVVDGPDADAFLTAQLGRSLPAVADPQGPLAAWHDAKGRVQGLFRVFRPAADTFWLTTPADAAAGIVTDLSRFVLRARVALRIDAGALECVALLGPCERLTAAHAGPPEGGHGILMAQLGAELVQAIGPATLLAPLHALATPAPPHAAELAEIRLGLPSVDARIRGQFLPQMLDLDRLGGVEFDKGCYPGQEIIVRIQHRGSVKRRLTGFTCASAPQPPASGDAILDAAGQRVGEVVRAAPAEADIELLAVVETASLRGPLRLDGDPPHMLTAVGPH